MKYLFFSLFFILIQTKNGFSQCCGGCNPIGGNTNQGTLPKNILQLNTYYKYGYSERYKEEDHISDFKFVKNATSSFINLQVGYGVTKRFTAQAEVGYYLNRTQNFATIGTYTIPSLNGFGGSSAILTGKYNIVKDTTHDFEFTMGLGVKMPWGFAPQIVNGVELSEDVQPSNGAYGLVLQSFLFKQFDRSNVRIFLINGITYNTVNQRNYKEGNMYLTSFFVSKTFLQNITGIFQLRNEIKDFAYRDNLKVSSSGGYKFVFVPQLNYKIKQNYNVSVLYELPIYQYYNGIQLNDKYAFTINLNIRFGLTKNANELCAKPN